MAENDDANSGANAQIVHIQSPASNFLRPPKPLQINHQQDAAKEWKLWKQQYGYFEVATQLTNKTEQIQIATFMTAIGQEAIEIYNSIPSNADTGEDQTLEQVKKKFEDYFAPKASVTFERYKFNKIEQKDETIDELVKRLRTQAKLCEFGQLADSLIRD